MFEQHTVISIEEPDCQGEIVRLAGLSWTLPMEIALGHGGPIIGKCHDLEIQKNKLVAFERMDENYGPGRSIEFIAKVQHEENGITVIDKAELIRYAIVNEPCCLRCKMEPDNELPQQPPPPPMPQPQPRKSTELTFGQWLGAIRSPGHNEIKLKALGESTGAAGGFVIPVQYADRILARAAEMSVIRPHATVFEMASNQIKIPTLDLETAPSSGQSAFLGGVVCNWTAENAITATQPRFRQLDMTAHELDGYTQASNALVEDGGKALDELLTSLFARAIAWYEDYAFLRGDGAGKPLGIVQSAALISVTRSGGSAFTLADAAGMFARLWPQHDPKKTFWAMHPTVVPKFLTMQGAGTGSAAVTIRDDVTAPLMWRLFGYPVFVSEKLPALNTAGDVLLVDGSAYVIGHRTRLELSFSEHVGFLTNEATWRFVRRVAGQPWVNGAITLADASSTVSPFVALAAG